MYLGWRIHGSVEDTKLSTNKQHSLSWCEKVKGYENCTSQQGYEICILVSSEV
jgi:hypothetical protein